MLVGCTAPRYQSDLLQSCPNPIARSPPIRTATSLNTTTRGHTSRKLELHARSEELFYPAAVLVGDLVRARLQGATR